MPSYIVVDDLYIPYKIILERRMSSRFSIASKSAIARIPKWDTKSGQERSVQKFKDWVKEVSKKKSGKLHRFRVKDYLQDPSVMLMGQLYSIHTSINTKSKKIEGRIDKDQKMINIALPEGTQHPLLEIQRLIKNMVKKGYVYEVYQRLLHFARPYGFKFANLTLKDNATNWGSCSGKKNINISIRTLLLPIEIMDYVLVHELCHLQELNHGPRFWALVEQGMPDYQKIEKWLDKHGTQYQF